MRLKKGDTVLIISGKDRNKKGKILRIFPARQDDRPSKILVEGINLRKKHQRPKRTGEKGQIVTLSSPVNVSNIKLVCPKCGKAARVGYKIISKAKGQKLKVRVCKKCGQEI